MYHYTEFPPPTTMTRYISTMWRLVPEPWVRTPDLVQTLVPDGNTELAVEYIYSRTHDGRESLDACEIYYIGQMQRAVTFTMSPGRVIYGVRFTPAGIFSFLHEDNSQLVDRICRLHEIIGAEGRQLEEEMFRVSGDRYRLQAILSFLERRFREQRDVGALHDYLIASRADSQVVDVRALSSALGLSVRQVERNFKIRVGISPKYLNRIWRIQRLVKLHSQLPHLPLSQLALEVGFFDQPHFNRDVRHFTGMTPTQYFSGHHHLSQSFSVL